MGEKVDATKNFLFENVLSVVTEHGKDFLKENALPLLTNEIARQGGDILIDYGASLIPGIGGAITEFRTSKKIRNLEVMVQVINKRNEELKEKFEKQTLENKEILDNIFEMVMQKIESTNQSEKIEFMINGYSEFLNLDNPSFDVAYLYFDTLDKLTILDISVLKLSYKTNTLDDIDGYSSYTELLEAFDINYNQYVAVRENLYRLGLMQNEYDNKLVKDIKNLQVAIDEIRNSTESILNSLSGKRNQKLKKLTVKSKISLKAKDKLKISKFGRDFIRFFIINNQ
ncbi:hypothetical protein [Enterococcus faecium]|uniref:hypothetical protein n=1 Tax=Enterococcus faecium TaxID=1352 RepID=UPI0010C0265B|nr:hypothetical protein [Enterococcus faecium]TKN40532.1 hypothetical protein DVW97_02095 [Enterococcus faecium]TKN54736.1 hypothetical protein DVX18_07895 [Enterococcus faecium]TKN56779.1 hypothetical protein DVX16_07970 [Enterococcus faecium]TKN74454.1 hypothetical protein DVX21_01220 [Enterococcus faecium]TKN80599.1 hypothetical protein DVX09_07650 [Enterococcus faecium]